MTRVTLIGGDGRVARRATAVLFTPAPDATLLTAFDAADDGAELQALASTTVAEGFTVTPFAAVSWSGATVRVMVFGDVALETDQPSLPMLSGAASRTWVEHTIVLDGPAVISVGDREQLAGDTALGDGIVLAGGFELAVRPDAEDPPAASTIEPSPVPMLEPEPEPEPEPAPAPSPEPESEPVETASPPTMSTPTPVDARDPEAALAAIQAAAMDEDGLPVAAVGATAPPAAPPAPAGRRNDPVDGGEDAVDDDPDITLAPPEADAVRDEARAHTGPSLVEAKRCPRQHANPPSASTCTVCDELLPPGNAAVVHIPQPVLGAIVLDDGVRVPLDQDLILGRNPGTIDDHDVRAVRVAGEKVSRRHLDVRRKGWEVVVTDLGSTNGSFVVAHPGGPVLALDPDRPQLVEPGATVYFGSRSFTLTDRQELR